MTICCFEELFVQKAPAYIAGELADCVRVWVGVEDCLLNRCFSATDDMKLRFWAEVALRLDGELLVEPTGSNVVLRVVTPGKPPFCPVASKTNPFAP
jgi:hypothetical protein